MFHTVGVDSRIEFVDTDFVSSPSPSVEPVYITVDRRETTIELVTEILQHFRPKAGYASLETDATAVAERIEHRLEGAECH